MDFELGTAVKSVFFLRGEVVVASCGRLEGKIPFPFNSQYKFTSGNAFITFITNSRLGLFLPVNKCEILERCTLMLSANAEADSP